MGDLAIRTLVMWRIENEGLEIYRLKDGRSGKALLLG